MSQHEKILKAIDERGSITNREIYVELNINGATARISELRDQGFNITSVREKNKDGTPYNRYFRGPDEFNNYSTKNANGRIC